MKTPVRPPLRVRSAMLALAIIVVSAAMAVQYAHASSAYSYTLWSGTPYIANTAVPDSGSVEVGVKFLTDVAGTVTGVRFYKGTGNTGTHVGNLWDRSGTRLATTTFTNETASGWQQANFSSPVAINANTTYIASYFAPNGHYAFTAGLSPGDFSSAADNPPLHALASGVDGPNGVSSYGAASTFPNHASPSAGNYWVDVFVSATVTTAPVAGSLFPANGATGVAQTALVTARFNEEIQPGTLSFSLTGPGGAVVPANVTWELHTAADRVVTLDPIAGLAAGTAYTASLSGGTDFAGNMMAPVSWSFTTTASAQPPPSSIGQWQPVQKSPVVQVHGGLLYNGNVLGFDPQSPTTTSQVFNPSTGTFTPPAPMNVDSFCGGMVQMADGRLMVVGGDHGDNDNSPTYGIAIAATVAYDPAAGTWTRLADMNRPRWYPGVTRLGDGRILAISGALNSAAWADTPEVYDPQTNTWTLLTNVNTSDVHEELYPQTYLLPNGKVFTYAESTGHTWILDVDAQTWTPGPQAPVFNASTVQYRPGKIMISGGTIGTAGYGTSSGAAAAVLDMTAATPAWQTIASMRYARSYHQLTALPDGRVIAVGGSTIVRTGSLMGILPAEVWDPTTGAWTVLAAEQDPRMNHSTGLLLADGTIFAAGGGHELAVGARDYFTQEIYNPPYLYGGARPAITSPLAPATYGAPIAVQTPSPSSIGSVALIGLAATTHRYDSGATYQSLAFTTGPGQLNVTMPASTNVAPPGYYMLFLVTPSGVPSVAAILQLTGTDATPPAVAAVSPANGSTATPGTTPSATFTKQMQPASIQFSLTDSALNSVATSTSYSTATHTATFTPVAPLRPSTTYTAKVSAAADTAGNAMAGTYSWSFNTSAPPSCPCSIWTSSTFPSNPSVYDTHPVELGVKFQPDTNGYITGVQFYKGANNTGQHTGNLWTNNGTLLATAIFTNESPTGWQTVTFQNPVQVTAGTVYVASYFAPNGNYAADNGYFTSVGHGNTPLFAMKASTVGGNGVYTYGPASSYPINDPGGDTNYWVDVTFVVNLPSSTTPPDVARTSPASGATGVNTGTAPSATFTEAVQPSTIVFSLVDAASNAVAGSTSYDNPSATATFTPSSPLAYTTTYTATVSGAKDLNQNVMSHSVSWSFTTAAPVSCPCTVWSASTTPGTPAVDDGNAVELGVKFRTDINGYITGLRFYKGAGNGGTHVGNLWADTGTRLATATFTNEGPSGWQTVAFSTPVSVIAGSFYIASYFAPQGHYAYDGFYFSTSGADASPLHALKAGVDGANAVYAYASSSTFPGTSSTASPNYWVDPIFEPAPGPQAPTVTVQSPANGATSVATSTAVTATFSKAVRPSSISFSLTNGSNTVPGTWAYNALTYTMTFKPSSLLLQSVSYTATVSAADLAGTAMAAPVTWSFTTAGNQCPCTIWPLSTTPGNTASSDTNSIELGVQFTADFSGHVLGVRFYKGAGNIGTHVGNLWSSSGQLLATATLAPNAETTTGWQQVNFSTPVAITAGTVYVASYFAPASHYAFDRGYFAIPYDNPPLHAISPGNGIYRYSSTSTFPNVTNGANTNYWVDVILGS